MPSINCFWLDETDKVRRYLRRFRSGGPDCSHPSPDSCLCCDASVVLDVVHVPEHQIIESCAWPQEDTRWPARCARCGYVFVNEDNWQVSPERLYRRSDTGEIVTLREAGPGAMWDAWWMPSPKGPDGRYLVVRLPGNHEWAIDGPSSQHREPGAWTRTGTPPRITASPSILAGDYHGWLRDGVLSDA